jgi:hypothetical protein
LIVCLNYETLALLCEALFLRQDAILEASLSCGSELRGRERERKGKGKGKKWEEEGKWKRKEGEEEREEGERGARGIMI